MPLLFAMKFRDTSLLCQSVDLVMLLDRLSFIPSLFGSQCLSMGKGVVSCVSRHGKMPSSWRTIARLFRRSAIFLPTRY